MTTTPNTLTKEEQEKLAANNSALQNLQKSLYKQATFLTVQKDTPTQPSNTLGGRPYLPENAKIPTTPQGNPLVFLAQIALEDIYTPEFHPTLKTGYLQFYIDANNSLGCAYPSLNNDPNPHIQNSPSGFRVLHVETPITPQDVQPNPILTWENSHVTGKGLTPLKKDCPPSPGDYHFTPLLMKNRTLLKNAKIKNPWTDPRSYSPQEQNRPSSLYSGGNPYFTQNDIRKDHPHYTEVLLQIGYSKYTCIADAGEMCFLATKETLQNGQLTDIFYLWDSH